MNRQSIIVIIGAATVSSAATGFVIPAQAQNYPTKSIRFVLPFAAGSAVDVLARVYAQGMTETWKQQTSRSDYAQAQCADPTRCHQINDADRQGNGQCQCTLLCQPMNLR